MALPSLRRYDVQATYALVLALVSSVPCLAAVGLALRNYQPQLGQIVYGSGSLYLPGFLGCLLLSVVPGVIAVVLGLNSAGQRRNDRPMRSWIGFFLGGSVVTVDLILLLTLMMLRFQKPM